MPDTPANGPLLLGIDLGTSAVKVVVVDESGLVHGEGGAGFDTFNSLPLQAEQEPAHWLRATSEAMTAMSQSLRERGGDAWRDRVAAIGVTGQLPTLVCLNDAGPVGRAITWKDGRADEWAMARVDAARRADMYAKTGMPIDGRYLAPMLRFHCADRLEELTCILSAKDYLVAALTGNRVTEPSTAAGYGIYDLRERRFSEGLSDFWQLPRRLLPRILASNSLAGPLSAEGAALLHIRAGIPVSTGAADSVCASYAMAGLDEKVVSISFGSSAIIIAASRQVRFDASARYLVTPHVSDAWYGLEMDLLASGTGYRWVSDLFGWHDGELDAEAARSIPGARGLTFAPYLAGGEQGALWNPRLYGALLGLGLRHSKADIARAYLEGVFYEIKRCVAVLSENIRVDSVKVSGHITAAPSSLQLLADVLHLPVSIAPAKSPAAIGAARLALPLAAPAAGRAAGATRRDEPHLPHPLQAQAYAERYRAYLAQAATCE